MKQDTDEPSWKYGNNENTFNIQYINEVGFVAIDSNKKKLFTIFPFDNGPDYLSEGLFRIIEGGKIGFADLKGNIIIKPQFSAASPFHGSLAAYCENCVEIVHNGHKSWKNGKWGFIDQNGNRIIPAQFDKIIEDFIDGFALIEKNGVEYRIDKNGRKVKINEMNYLKWIEILGNVLHLANIIHFDNSLKIELQWNEPAKTVIFPIKDSNTLKITIDSKINKNRLTTYYLIPWQNFSIRPNNDFMMNIGLTCELITVTNFAIVYRSVSTEKLNKSDIILLEKFQRIFSTLIIFDKNPKIDTSDNINIPDNIQVISSEIYTNYLNLQVAIPGSKIPEPETLSQILIDRMLKLDLIPDIGTIQTRWIKPLNSSINISYYANETKLLKFYSEAIKQSMKNPNVRENIYRDTSKKMKSIFNTTNNYVNFLYDKYDSRLKAWMFIVESQKEETLPDNIFSEYTPKNSPDTQLDFMPEIKEEVNKIPEAKLENLNELILLFIYYEKHVLENKGEWVEGNIILGAQPQTYKPTSQELILSLVGDRINIIVKTHPKENIQQITETSQRKNQIEYSRFSIVHIDVMGSRRFYYIDSIEKITVKLK